MIQKQTVFILGAGASYSFGYPLGKNLVEIIIKNFDPDSPDCAIPLFMGLGFSESEILAFRNQLRLSATPSIDSFLEPRGEDERYLGKLAIAYALIPFEKTDTLFYDNSWYVTLLNKLKFSFNDFEKNKVAFITFNYDRSLEHFLMTALQNQFNKTEQEIAEKLKKIPIVHLYGKLGMLPWETVKPEEYSREYNPKILPHLLRRSSKSLKIIYDKVELDNAEFKQARQLISSARKVYFLGFGYHKDNLERLRIKSLLSSSPISTTTSTVTTSSIIAEGTCYRLPQDLKETVPKIYRIKFPNMDRDINEFFEQRIRLE
ncbi:MAG: hypothetical protein QM737_18715 [Ferruginibacter sp.]